VKKQNKIWIVAAGTGGHIFPGIAIAKELKSKHSSLEVEFFGTKDRLEEKLIPKQGFAITFLKAKQWKGKGFLHRFASLFALLESLVLIFKKAAEDKPLCLISVGGYVSMPVGLACWLRGIPLFLVEPNIRAGISNKILSQFALRAFTIPGSDALEKFKCPTLDTGNPVMGSFELNPLRKEAQNILILGGSQGAKILCSVGLSVFKKLKDKGFRFRLLLQSGEKNLEESLLLKKELTLTDECDIQPFFNDVPQKLAWADLVIARAGAMTLTELSLSCVPSVLVPFPAAADDHQRVNARILESAGAVRVVDEKEKDFEGLLERNLIELLSSPENHSKRSLLAKNMHKFARPQATQRIVSEILNSL
jgi:UDP-N-acetylglucosamine--N-acetylmuramyl-(pentapeptide) pyrophosphoryl-undecaprenol N-acetylglucosamine transferase